MFEVKPINTDHKDLIHDVSYDFYGRRMATCSSDQSVKVTELCLQELPLSIFLCVCVCVSGVGCGRGWSMEVHVHLESEFFTVQCMPETPTF